MRGLLQRLMLADLNDDLFRKIASRLAESNLASAVALKRCSRRCKDLAAPLVANAVSVTNEKWRDAAAKIGQGAHIKDALERNEVPTSLDCAGGDRSAPPAPARSPMPSRAPRS